MADYVEYDQYKTLVCAIILQMAKDFLKNSDEPDGHFKGQITNCIWFDFVDIDRDWFYKKIVELKKSGKTTLNEKILIGESEYE